MFFGNIALLMKKILYIFLEICEETFRYKEENPRFKYKLVDYLIKELLNTINNKNIKPFFMEV